jgi:serine protease
MTEYPEQPKAPIKVGLLILFFTAFLLFIQSANAQTDKYIIVYKSHLKKENAHKQKKFAISRSFNIIPAMAARLDANQVKQVREDPNVAYIEPDYKIYAFGSGGYTTTDSLSSVEALAASQSITYGVTMVNAPAVWSKTRGAGVRVAVLDTGISMYHPDRGNVVASVSYAIDPSDPTGTTIEPVEDFEGHGTHTSGTIAAADNGIGVVGVAPQADLLIAKVLDNTGTGDTSWLISGIEWAVSNNAKVISMSLGSYDYSAALDSACSNAFAAGTLLVAAAGNDNISDPTYPAALSSVISVAAVDQNKNKASFSNYGSDIALAAPGVNVYSTTPVVADIAASADAVWNSASHEAYPIMGTSAGTVSGLICDCGLATGSGSDVCPPAVAGNIAFIRRGTNYFSDKVAHAQSKGALGVIIANNVSGSFDNFTLGDGTPLVVAAISQSDGDALHSLIPSGITGTVSVYATLYSYESGTSMACPHVSGVAALIFAAADNQITPSQVRTILQNSAQDLGTAGRDDYFGYGLVDASAALNLIVPQTCTAVWTLGYGLTADIDRNCLVGWDDLRLFAVQWLTNGCNSSNNWCSRGDINQNGAVNILDFSSLASQWLNCNDPQHINCN